MEKADKALALALVLEQGVAEEYYSFCGSLFSYFFCRVPGQARGAHETGTRESTLRLIAKKATIEERMQGVIIG